MNRIKQMKQQIKTYEYRTLGTDFYQQAITVNKSRFIATVGFVANTTTAQALLTRVVKAHPHATHHCYTYVTADGQKSCDAGEPSGTAGVPILQAIQAQQLFNVAVIVTRYFGGVKLGTGGLARAYGQAATTALCQAPQAVAKLCARVTMTVPYDQVTAVEQVTAPYGIIEQRNFAEQVQLQLAIPVAQVTAWRRALPVNLSQQVKVLDRELWVTTPR